MKVTVVFSSHLVEAAGKPEFGIDLDEPACVEDAIREVVRIVGDTLYRDLFHEKTDTIQVICAVNGAKVTTQHTLTDNDELLLFPALSGG